MQRIQRKSVLHLKPQVGIRFHQICRIVRELKYQSTSAPPPLYIFGKLANRIIRDNYFEPGKKVEFCSSSAKLVNIDPAGPSQQCPSWGMIGRFYRLLYALDIQGVGNAENPVLKAAGNPRPALAGKQYAPFREYRTISCFLYN